MSADFAALATRVRGCAACADMDRCHVLGPANGPIDARLVVVGEAPGRHGAARSGVPFRGDRAGDRFEALLAAAGLDRTRAFVTNAVLCNPLTPDGRNRRPRAAELAACSEHLRATLDLVRAPVVAALGDTALRALARLAPLEFASVTAEAGRPRPWRDRVLVPLVHPSPRTQGRRAWARQLEDWRALGCLVEAQRCSSAAALPTIGGT